jgi:hypothetical protein
MAARTRGVEPALSVQPRATPEPIPSAPSATTSTRTRRVWIVIAIVVGGLIIVNLLAQGLDNAVGGNQPGGATGSSYATAPAGLAAFGSLLSHFGHPVGQQRGSIGGQELPTNATVFVLEPTELTAGDAAALVQFVSGGGRLVVGGRSPFYLRNLSDKPPKWNPAGDTSWIATGSTFGAVHGIRGAGVGSWSSVGAGTALVGVGNFALVTHEPVGRGEIFFLADTSPLQNTYLSTGDDASFGLGLAGDPSRPVVFAEGVHGFGTSRGIAAIPDRWKIALLLVAFAAVVLAWSRSWRFGPPDQNARDLPPARAQYVDALSISLERTHDRKGALAPAQRWARSRLAMRAGLGANANDEDLVRAAHSFGCTSEEATALVAPISDDAGVLAFGRAVARVGGRDGRMQ